MYPGTSPTEHTACHTASSTAAAARAGPLRLMVFGNFLVNGQNLSFRLVDDLDVRRDLGGAGRMAMCWHSLTMSISWS